MLQKLAAPMCSSTLTMVLTKRLALLLQLQNHSRDCQKGWLHLPACAQEHTSVAPDARRLLMQGAHLESAAPGPCFTLAWSTSQACSWRKGMLCSWRWRVVNSRKGPPGPSFLTAMEVQSGVMSWVPRWSCP